MVYTITHQPSARANIITRRTYNRPLNAEGTIFESWAETVDRVIEHQRWLWENALGGSLNDKQGYELEELRDIILMRKVLPAGRTLWLGGTELVKKRAMSNFNCCFLEVRTVHDLVDIFWLLLQGCGVGFKSINGALSGFTRRMHVEIIRSTRTSKGGSEDNVETYDPETKVWTIKIGDSAESWAKSLGKIVAGKFPAKKLVISMEEIRPAGTRLAGYGWICCGDRALSEAYTSICTIMNRQAGKLLSKIDILDIVNWLGTVLSNRRSAQICLMDYGDAEWKTFATAKPVDYWEQNPQRAQSNNSIVFHEPPNKRQLKEIFELMVAHGGAEPGFINMQQMLRRAPWAAGLNPCGEVILANKNCCNLCEIDVARFRGDHMGLHKAGRLIARANYRQTLVNMRDGILQDAWHQTNEFLRLCGVGLTGIVRRPDLTPYDFRQLRNTVIAAAYSQADELGLERPKNVTTVKPSGTASKIMDTTEGAHRPLGKFIFNNVSFSRHDPLVTRLLDANYHLFDHPTDKDAIIARLPVSWEDVEFDIVNGKEVNRETAISQLERYKSLQQNWCDQNTSITVSYDPHEVPQMVEWFQRNWDNYVAVSFLFRNDATKTAKDLGFPYLPQEVVTKEVFNSYVQQLELVDIDNEGSADSSLEEECVGGMCPIR